MNWRLPMACALAAVIAGCASVPDKLPPPTLKARVPLAGLPTSAHAGWPDPQWWKRYHDPQLDRLVHMALANSPNLAVARSRVQQAVQRARVVAAQSGLSVGASAQVSRKRMSEHGLIPSKFLGFTWYNQADLGVQLQYSFDWWGKHQAAVEAAIGQARAAQAQRSAAALALQSLIARQWFGWLADQARLKLASERVTAQQKLVHIARVRTDAGLESADKVHQARAALAAARQQQTAFKVSARTRRASLAALLGRAPAQLPALKAHPLPEPHASLPDDAGIDLIARRPDIAASRWQVQAALRQTDVARAQFLPDISIKALAGLSSIDLGKLFETGSRTFALTPALHLPIFEGGLLQANYGMSTARLDAAIAQYNATLVDAAREVSTQVLAIQRLARQREQQRARVQANVRIASTARARHAQGLTSARPALAARKRLLTQRDAAVALKAQALTAGVGLIQALGGGYRSDVSKSTSTTSRSGASHD
ncbi:MAG TPA: efflux transporter outer membrane subunit [Oleiagrimonas sp.]|nr:efflux transporter outer membrane subunit [Oleiagrimonas sp.]